MPPVGCGPLVPPIVAHVMRCAAPGSGPDALEDEDEEEDEEDEDEDEEEEEEEDGAAGGAASASSISSIDGIVRRAQKGHEFAWPVRFSWISSGKREGEAGHSHATLFLLS